MGQVALAPALASASPRAQVVAPALVGASRAAEDARQQTMAVKQAYDLLLDRYVQPLDSAALLRAGWEALAGEAQRRGAPAPGPAPTLTGDRAADIATVTSALAAYLEAVPALPEGFVPAHAIGRGLAAFVNEGHTVFLNPRQYDEHLAWTRGEVTYAGIGARMRGPELTITEVFEASPAERAGLRPGDVILEVDGLATAGKSVEETVGLIRGPEGSSVALLVRRADVPEPFGVTVWRERISLAFVTHRLLPGNVAYIRLRGFPEPSVVEQIERYLAADQEAGVRGLVLDLRGNSGGRLDVGNRLLSRFLPGGADLYQQVDRGGNQQTRASRAGLRYDLPLAVLVDGGTASMGEIFASAIQEHGAGTVIGTTTAGSVAAAQVFPIGDGSAMQVTVMEIRSASGRPLNGVGVVPDEVVDATETPAALAAGQDRVLERALAVLTGASDARQPAPFASARHQAF